MKKLLTKNCRPVVIDGIIQCTIQPCPKPIGQKGCFSEDCFAKPHEIIIAITDGEKHIETLKVSTELSNTELRTIIRSKLEETCVFI